MRRLSGPTSDQAWSRVERRLRADLEAGETFVPRRADPLPVPLSAFGGRSDPSVTEQALSGWFARTTRFLGVRMFAGGHFYFRPDPSALLAAVVRDIRSATATTFDTFARP
jgi:surfactin synthase thioesterase subunit